MGRTFFTELEETNRNLLTLIASFTPKQFNTVPGEGGWTAGQVADHLVKSDTFIIKTLTGPTKATERPPDQQIQQIKEQFLDFTTKMTSPEIIIPRNIPFDSDTLLRSLKDTRAQITEAATTLDLSVTCPNPVLGELTRLEIVHFVIYHTQRHIHQLKKIYVNLPG